MAQEENPPETLRERDVFWTALMFYTRLPVPSSYRYDPILLEKATRWLPAVGIILAVLTGLGGGLASLLVLGIAWLGGFEASFAGGAAVGSSLSNLLSGSDLPAGESLGSDFSLLLHLDPNLAWLAAGAGAVTCLGLGLLLAGAFHEDGFADLWDGFGGGLGNRERTLEIMKDSRLGTFGGAGLFILLLARLGLYASLMVSLTRWFGLWHGMGIWILALAACQALARVVPMLVIMWSRYARTDASAKAKPLATRLTLGDAWPGFATALVPLTAAGFFLFSGWIIPLVMVVCMPLIALGCKKWFESVLDGFTGDCLGASEQIAEVFCLVVTAAAVSGLLLSGPGLATALGV